MFNLFLFGCAFSTITRTSFTTATFSQPTSSTQWIIFGGYSYLGIMPVDIEQWHAEIEDFNGCLHYPTSVCLMPLYWLAGVSNFCCNVLLSFLSIIHIVSSQTISSKSFFTHSSHNFLG